MLHTIILTLAFFAPFEDTQKRFTVDLPQGWEFAPVPGDITVATFRCKRDKGLAFAAIRVLPASSDTTLDILLKTLVLASAKEPGYKQQTQELIFLAGMSAMRRVYQAKVNDKLEKTVEQRFAIGNHNAYVVQVESLNETYGLFKEDFRHLFDSFVPALPVKIQP